MQWKQLLLSFSLHGSFPLVNGCFLTARCALPLLEAQRRGVRLNLASGTASQELTSRPSQQMMNSLVLETWAKSQIKRGSHLCVAIGPQVPWEGMEKGPASQPTGVHFVLKTRRSHHRVRHSEPYIHSSSGVRKFGVAVSRDRGLISSLNAGWARQQGSKQMDERETCSTLWKHWVRRENG
jgi:hypothetical protein